MSWDYKVGDLICVSDIGGKHWGNFPSFNYGIARVTKTTEKTLHIEKVPEQMGQGYLYMPDKLTYQHNHHVVYPNLGSAKEALVKRHAEVRKELQDQADKWDELLRKNT